MPMDAREIESLIKAALPDAAVEIRDLAGDGDHYAATVTSAAFQGKSRVQQHQMVHSALQGRMGGVLLALALTTVASEISAPGAHSPGAGRARGRTGDRGLPLRQGPPHPTIR